MESMDGEQNLWRAKYFALSLHVSRANVMDGDGEKMNGGQTYFAGYVAFRNTSFYGVN